MLEIGNIIDNRYIVEQKWNHRRRMWQLYDLRTGDVLYVTWRGMRALFGGGEDGRRTSRLYRSNVWASGKRRAKAST